MDRLLVLAGAVVWLAAMAVVVQRQRVLHRRLARLERAAGIRRSAGIRVPAPVVNNAVKWTGNNAVKWTGRWVPVDLPTVQQLARLAQPLQRAGG